MVRFAMELLRTVRGREREEAIKRRKHVMVVLLNAMVGGAQRAESTRAGRGIRIVACSSKHTAFTARIARRMRRDVVRDLLLFTCVENKIVAAPARPRPSANGNNITRD